MKKNRLRVSVLRRWCAGILETEIKRATQFKIWATSFLKESIIKGFAMDDERLKQSERWEYFDEWLERIRDIRASEKRFYQKIRDMYATAIFMIKEMSS